jgi:hypothetical protein
MNKPGCTRGVANSVCGVCLFHLLGTKLSYAVVHCGCSVKPPLDSRAGFVGVVQVPNISYRDLSISHVKLYLVQPPQSVEIHTGSLNVHICVVTFSEARSFFFFFVVM